ncbi:MAG: UDP-3-O-[3-hydroxymyristoyl] N-acetylglucosamine deacetylase [Halanaerobiales bacterium]|nr:UDP-3-O-[3-hydroxymyristoyl] N-acetylglucosamine deacetylase [Halanaerobiales bacterium]
MFREGELQKTIANPIEYSGIALHTGKEVNIKCLPAEANRGIIFRRIDLPEKPEIKADSFKVVSTRRCTSIGLAGEDQPRVHTVEHMMSAFWAMGVDNIIIEIDNAETPVGDGSALPFIKLLQKAGIKELGAPRQVWKIDQPLWVKKGKMYLVILPYEGFKISYTLDYDHPVIGTQFYEFDQEENSFIDEIAPARTFGFEREVEALHRRGLALGGSLENAVLIGEEETVNPLRFPDEFVRHKILDVIGDMALNGFIRGHIIAVRSGHYLHVELAKKIREKNNPGR